LLGNDCIDKRLFRLDEAQQAVIRLKTSAQESDMKQTFGVLNGKAIYSFAIRNTQSRRAEAKVGQRALVRPNATGSEN
jgi:hypothetical protein